MNFDLSDEHRMLQATVREFVAKEVARRARHVDETGEFPWPALNTMGRLGLLGLNVPEAYGGGGADYLSVALMLAEIGKGCGSTGLIVAAHLGLACGPLALFGTEEQKQRWLTLLAQGKILGCLGLTEPGAGCDLRGIRTTAVRDGESWIINGSKMWLTNGAEAGWRSCSCAPATSSATSSCPPTRPASASARRRRRWGCTARTPTR